MSDSKYTIKQIGEHSYAIDGINKNSIYLSIHAHKAFVIDTGMVDEPLLPVLEAITDKPIECVLTHAHVDHMDHAEAFKQVYVGAKDKQAWKWKLRVFSVVGSFALQGKVRCHPVSRYTSLYEGDILTSGKSGLKVVELPGHTPGSLVLIDESDRIVYTGDSFGKPVWLWILGAQSVEIYQQNIRHALKVLAPYADYTYHGGHTMHTDWNYPDTQDTHLSYQTLIDMDRLCSDILEQRIEPEKTTVMGFPLENFENEGAGILTMKHKIYE